MLTHAFGELGLATYLVLEERGEAYLLRIEWPVSLGTVSSAPPTATLTATTAISPYHWRHSATAYTLVTAHDRAVCYT